VEFAALKGDNACAFGDDGRNANLIPQFLSHEEVEECLEKAGTCEWRANDEGAWARDVDEDGDPIPGLEVNQALTGVARDMVFSEKHVSLFLHRDGYFQQACPSLCRKLVSCMCSQPGLLQESESDLHEELHVRCIELHSYVAGGGLFSAGHRDNGSIVSMAVLLSDENEMSGGEFITYSNGLPVVHSMSKGDALVFQSEDLHNVAPVLSGTRRSLVLELWKGPTNSKNRFF
jgi:hypothetical protein